MPVRGQLHPVREPVGQVGQDREGVIAVVVVDLIVVAVVRMDVIVATAVAVAVQRVAQPAQRVAQLRCGADLDLPAACPVNGRPITSST